MNRLICLLLLALAAGPAGAQKMVLRVSTAAPPPDFRQPLAAAVQARARGCGARSSTCRSIPAASSFRQGTEVPAMQRGNLEMSTMTTFEVAQQIPEFGFFNRAYLFRDYDARHKSFTGPIGKRLRAMPVSQKMGISILAPTYLGTRQVNLRRRAT